MATAVRGSASGGSGEQIARLAAGSANFGHLLQHEPLLVTLGCAAESYVHTDPHAAMMKTRLFGEVMARHVLTLLNLPREDRQVDRITALTRAGVLVPQVRGWFDGIRTTGNRAVHEYYANVMPEGRAWEGRGWPELLSNDGAALETAYAELLEDLGNQRKDTTFHLIFNGARNRIHDPAKLKRLVNDLIDKENWSGQKTDIKGDAYEELLSRGAEDIKSGAGQYFTPRPLTQTIVDCVRPTPDDTITDPACGTGGFLLASAEYLFHE